MWSCPTAAATIRAGVSSPEIASSSWRCVLCSSARSCCSPAKRTWPLASSACPTTTASERADDQRCGNDVHETVRPRSRAPPPAFLAVRDDPQRRTTRTSWVDLGLTSLRSLMRPTTGPRPTRRRRRRSPSPSAEAALCRVRSHDGPQPCTLGPPVLGNLRRGWLARTVEDEPVADHRATDARQARRTDAPAR